MVINCITLETVGEAMECIRELEGKDLLFPGKRGCPAGSFPVKISGTLHMMMGENPVYGFTIQAHK